MIPELKILLAALVPYLDMKFAIPLGRKLEVSSTNIFIFAVIGTILPGIILLTILEPLTEYCRQHNQKLDKFITKIFDKTHKEHSSRFLKYGPVFLILLVATPLPGSGPVTGAIIAYLFKVDYWKSIALITIGTAIQASLVMTGIHSAHTLASLFQ